MVDQSQDYSQYDDFLRIFQRGLKTDEAAIYANSTGQNLIRTLTIDLSVAKLPGDPFRVGFPFKSIYVISATDPSTTVNMRLGTRDSSEDSFPLAQESTFELPFPVKEAYIDWTAQAGKTITILFSIKGTFKSNKIASITSGGVLITEGTALTTQTGGTIPNTAQQLFAQDSSRKLMVIQNQDSIPFWIGDASVTTNSGSKPGIMIQPGSSYEWKSTAACYFIGQVAGSANQVALMYFS